MNDKPSNDGTQIVMVAAENFVSQVLESEAPVLVACLHSREYFEEKRVNLALVHQKFNGALKVCVAERESLGVINDLCGIEGAPTFLIFEKGGEVGRLLGEWDEFLLSDFVSQTLFPNN